MILVTGSTGNVGAALLQRLVGADVRVGDFEETVCRDERGLDERTATFLDACVRGRLNIAVSGGTGTCMTTLLIVLSSFIPDQERIVVLEDAKELRLRQPHVLYLEARPPNIEARGEVTIRDLLHNALRLRRDRIVVGECRSGEALDMLQAMNTGHDGSLATVQANSPRDTLSRIETMALMAGVGLPVRAIREQMASALHLIVHLARSRDGARRVTGVTEVFGMEQDTSSSRTCSCTIGPQAWTTQEASGAGSRRVESGPSSGGGWAMRGSICPPRCSTDGLARSWSVDRPAQPVPGMSTRWWCLPGQCGT